MNLEQINRISTVDTRIEREDWIIPGGVNIHLSVRIFRPKGVPQKLPVVMYFHGDLEMHDQLMCEIALGANVAVICMNETRFDPAEFPNVIEQAHIASCWILEHGHELNLDGSRMALAGDNIGGHLAVTVALMAQQRCQPKIAFQMLFYPITDNDFGIESYRDFSDGPWLTKIEMEWVWGQYLTNPNVRTQSTMSPWHAVPKELYGLPTTLVITDEESVMRDEGESYANKLLAAGVDVTLIHCLGTTHDFVSLNTARAETRVAMDQAIASLRAALEMAMTT